MLRYSRCLVVSALVFLTGCPATSPPGPPATPPSPQVTPRTAAECEMLLSLRNRALGLLENEKIAECLPDLERLRQLLPDDPLPARNLAVAKLIGVSSGIVPPAELEATLVGLREQETSPKAQWLSGRCEALLAERADSPARRDTWLESSARRLKAVMDQETTNAPVAFELFEATRYATDESLRQLSTQALRVATARAPENLFLLTEQLLQQADAHDDACGPTLDTIAGIAGPLREGILRRARVDLKELITQARSAVDAGDWRIVLARSRQLVAIIRPEDRAQSDRRQLTVHPLEFVLSEFSTITCPPSSGTADPPTTWSLSETPFNTAGLGTLEDVQMMDWDLDGRQELLVLGTSALRVLGQDGAKGPWATRWDVSLDREFLGVLAADLDRDTANTTGAASTGVCQDADPDVILFGRHGVHVLRNQVEGEERQLVPIEQPVDLTNLLEIRNGVPGDFDHDGDLDLALLTLQGLRIWSQTGGLRFADQSDRILQPDSPDQLRGLVAVDWDRDVDLDLIASDGLFENLRHGEFRWRAWGDDPDSDAITDVAVVEADGNVSWDRVAAGDQGLSLTLTTTPTSGVNRVLRTLKVKAPPVRGLVTGDWNNDGWIDLATWHEDGMRTFHGQGGGSSTPGPVLPYPGLTPRQIRPCDIDQDGDLDWLVLSETNLALIQNDCDSRQHWLTVRVRGDEEARSGRVNQYGVGSLVEVRFQDRYQARVIDGQSTHFGLGAIATPDSVRVLWTNGVPQVVLQPRADQALCERLALKGSCPYVYTWNGERFEFFTDLLWAAPLGLQFAEGVIAPDRPWEYLRVPGSALVANDGHYDLRITEELWEAAYFDQVELLAVDHPADVEIYSNEKVGPAALSPFQIHTVREPRLPVAARDQQGRDLREPLSRIDGVYARCFDRTLRQGLTELHALELDLGPLDHPRRITLFLAGWIYPTDTSLNVALSQDPTIDGPRPPSLSVPNARGNWEVVRPFMGFPGGKTKTIAIDLSGLFSGDDYRVRLETTQQICWDAAFFTVDELSAETRVISLPLASASLRYRGFSEPYPTALNAPETYDYSRVSTIPKWPPMEGRFTRYGDVLPVLKNTDDQLVVMSSGDEIALRFRVPDQPVAPGWKRDFILHNVGWDKDADLHTVYGQSSEPYPFQQMEGYPYPVEISAPDSVDYRRYLQQFQTRRESPAHFWKWRAP